MGKRSQFIGLDFKEIRDDTHFEQLVRECFERMAEQTPHLSSVEVRQGGKGTDEGCDLLLSFEMADNILASYPKTWVIQCKFHTRNISPRHINEINIPSLIHSNGADGYLLVCSSQPTSGTTKLLDKLRANCKFNYKYECWDGEKLKEKILSDTQLQQQFFPMYYSQKQKEGS
jgi:hypothetical protein